MDQIVKGKHLTPFHEVKILDNGWCYIWSAEGVPHAYSPQTGKNFEIDPELIYLARRAAEHEQR